MQHTYLLPEYPPAAEAWSENLPHSIRLEAEAECEGRLLATMFYRIHRVRAARSELVMSEWSYAYDACGRILKIEFSGKRELGIYATLYNAVLSIRLFAQHAIDPAGVHFDLMNCARGLLNYFDTKEQQLRTELVIPFPSSLI